MASTNKRVRETAGSGVVVVVVVVVAVVVVSAVGVVHGASVGVAAPKGRLSCSRDFTGAMVIQPIDVVQERRQVDT